MALILTNPMHNDHHVIHNHFLDALNYIYLFGYHYFYAPYLNAVNFIFYHTFIYLPVWTIYRWIRMKLLY